MRTKPERPVNYLVVAILLLVLTNVIAGLFSTANAAEQPAPAAASPKDIASEMGGVQIGENLGGIIDRIYVVAGPNRQFVISVDPGSYLDCGRGMQVAETGEDGRHMFPLTCGVSEPEALIVPPGTTPAHITIHY